MEIQSLIKLSKESDIDVERKIKDIEKKKQTELNRIYSNLSPWQIVKLARHPNRPKTKSFINSIFTKFTPLYGDRLYSEDNAIISGFAFLDNLPVVILGTEKGNDMNTRLKHNFGMAKPEGYRKALRVMKLAVKFNRPIICFIDTPGAYPGIDAESRNQSQAIAENLYVMSNLKVPIISVVIGEGGSGGALAIGIADRLCMLQNSIYSVISPEGCASILWKDSKKASHAAEALCITSNKLLKFNLIDKIIPEPLGGAHRDIVATSSSLKMNILSIIDELNNYPVDQLLSERHNKIQSYGEFEK